MTVTSVFTAGEETPFGNFAPVTDVVVDGAGSVTMPLHSVSVVKLASDAKPPQPGDIAAAKAADAAPVRPAWLPEKFKTAEDMAAAYSQLERKLSSAPKATNTPEAPAPGEAPPDAKPVEPGAANPPTASPFATVEAEMAAGDLTPATRAAIKAAGVPDSVLDGAIAAMKFSTDAIVGMAHDAFGGPEAYTEMAARAATEVSEPDRNIINGLLTSGSYAKARQGIEMLKDRMSGFLSPGNGSYRAEAADDGFKSQLEMLAAQRDPKYAKDALYTAEFERKSELLLRRMSRAERRR